MTSLGRSPLKPKESSGRSSYPTAGDIAAEIDAPQQIPVEDSEPEERLVEPEADGETETGVAPSTRVVALACA